MFPTPPSSASTPPTATHLSDAPPPRKRPRLNPPANPAITTPEEPVDVPLEASTGLTIKMPRIRIKWAPESPKRTSTRLAGRQEGEEVEDSEMDEEEEMTTPAEEEAEEVKEEGWDDQEVCEMVEVAENWRVVGLLNVGNTCFTNAVLQVFSYQFLFFLRGLLMVDKLRFWENGLFDGSSISLHRGPPSPILLLPRT